MLHAVTCRHLQALQGAAEDLEAHLAKQQAALQQDCTAARAALQSATWRLQLELSSAGNVWLEEGGPGDSWVEVCHQLLNTCCLQPGAGEKPALQVQVCVTFLGHFNSIMTEQKK